jgi:hypothetical protein
MQQPINITRDSWIPQQVMHTTKEELLEMVFPIGSALKLYSEHKLDNLFNQGSTQ